MNSIQLTKQKRTFKNKIQKVRYHSPSALVYYTSSSEILVVKSRGKNIKTHNDVQNVKTRISSVLVYNAD